MPPTDSLPRADVVIVGAGPVGLAIAGDLGWRGVSCLVLEKTDGSITQPRMDLVGVRTMEFCRRWGIVPWVEDCPYPRDRPQDNVYVTSLTGYELGRESFPSMQDTRPPEQSPEHRYRCPQDMFDPILARHARSYGSVSFRYETTLVDLLETNEGVVCSARNERDGKTFQVLARFVVGCDGSSSSVRELLGVKMEGAGGLTYTTNVIFCCPELDRLHDKSNGYRWIFIGEEGTWATLVAINGVDSWRFSLIGDDRPVCPSKDEISAALARALGVDRSFDIRSILFWERREEVASSYRKGRIFLAGDACHLMSPTGGFGMNTGIGDAIDLSWKLSSVLSRWGGPLLFDSYEIERKPVAIRNATEASANLARMLEPRRSRPDPNVFAPGRKGDLARAEFGRHFSGLMSHEWHSLGIQLGYCYARSPLCIGDDGPLPTDGPSQYEQSTTPGARAPHVWLEANRSTLDWFGRGFTLVRLGGGARSTKSEAISLVAKRRGIPLEILTCEDERVVELYARRLVLVRPDGHVAWRSDDDLDEPAAERILAVVTGRLDKDRGKDERCLAS